MSFRLSALLCLSGLAACSQTTGAVKDPSYDQSSTVASTEPQPQPASLENRDAMAAPMRADTELRAPADGTSGPAKPAEAAPHGNPPTPATPAPAAAPERSGAAVDNTKVNERDRSSTALTPMDQNNNRADLDITQQIRQAVMADGSLSFTAKNIKIITQNGKVTLRGPVNSAQERNAIEAAARKVAGSQVDNQIEVKK